MTLFPSSSTLALRNGFRVLCAVAALGAVGCDVATLPSEANHPRKVDSEGNELGTTVVDQSAPEISRSVGSKGGAVVLWGRLFPRTDAETHALAVRLQKKLASLAKTALPDQAIDIRPEPQRVCPRQGCDGVSVSMVVTKEGKGCAAAVVIGKPGSAPMKIIPWIGSIKVDGENVPFRQPPESYMHVTELEMCAKIDDSLTSGAPPGDDPAVVEAIRSAGH